MPGDRITATRRNFYGPTQGDPGRPTDAPNTGSR